LSKRYVAGSGWPTDDATPIETGDGDVRLPAIVINSAGNALAVWSQWDGTRNSILSNRFD
jgi:hypothetical protein